MNANPEVLDIQRVYPRWGWLLLLGILLMFLGTAAFFLIPAATLGTVMVLGWLMTISGVIEAFHAFFVHRWSGFFLHLIGGILGVLVGLLVVTHPFAGALTLTLLFSVFFCVVGLFRLIASATLRFSHWAWAFLDGAIALALGLLLWLQLPWSGLWFLGLALGLSLVFRGWTYVMLSVAVRRLEWRDSKVR